MPNINQSIEWVLFLSHTKKVENKVFEAFYYSGIGISNAVFDLHLQSKHPDSRWNQPNTNAIIWKWDIFRDTFGIQMVQVEISYHSIYILVYTVSSCRLLSALSNCWFQLIRPKIWTGLSAKKVGMALKSSARDSLLVYDRNHLFGLGSDTETETENWPKL